MTWKLLCDECDDVHGAEPCYCGCTEKPPFTAEDVELLRETASDIDAYMRDRPTRDLLLALAARIAALLSREEPVARDLPSVAARAEEFDQLCRDVLVSNDRLFREPE